MMCWMMNPLEERAKRPQSKEALRASSSLISNPDRHDNIEYKQEDRMHVWLHNLTMQKKMPAVLA